MKRLDPAAINPNYDPMVEGPKPLIVSADGKNPPWLEKLLDELRDKLVGEIRTAVHRDADPLIKRGYRANELLILGWGPQTYVVVASDHKHTWMRLFLRRAWMRLCIWMPVRIHALSHFYNYAAIPVADRDTKRLIVQLAIFPEPKTATLANFKPVKEAQA